MEDNYRQQTSLSLTFARPWAMPNLVMDKKVRIFENIDATPHRSNFQTYPYYLQPWGL